MKKRRGGAPACDLVAVVQFLKRSEETVYKKRRSLQLLPVVAFRLVNRVIGIYESLVCYGNRPHPKGAAIFYSVLAGKQRRQGERVGPQGQGSGLPRLFTLPKGALCPWGTCLAPEHDSVQLRLLPFC